MIARLIRDRLTLLAPEHKEAFQENYEIFSNKLRNKIMYWKALMDPLKEHRFITYHKVWAYFFDCFELTSLGELEPLPGIQPTVKHLAELKYLVATADKPILILTANFYSSRYVKAFAESIEAKWVITETNAKGSDKDAYIALFDYMVAKITK